MNEIFSDIPLWVLLIWGITVVILSLFYYRRKSWVKEISKIQRATLIALRTFGLLLLGLLLIGILIKGITKEINKPIIISIVDDSESMMNYADSSTLKNQVIDYLKTADLQFNEEYNHLLFTLTDELQNIDSLKFNNSKTNISQILNKVYDNYYGRNIGAVILLSDGNFNAGVTPLMAADKFKKTPIYTLSVGDTIQKSDHLIKAILANEITFLNNKFPVEVTIEGNKTDNQNFEIQLIKDGKIIATQNLKHQESDYSLLKTTFEVEADATGIHEYTVKLSHLSNEYNYENNEKSFFIEVLDGRSKILMVYEALNPDVGAVKNALIGENNLEVEVTSIDDLPTSPENYDLLVWFDPGVSRNRNNFNKITTQFKKSIWYFITPQTNRSDIASLQLQADINITGRNDNVGASYNQTFNLFNLSPETKKAIDRFPPLKAHYGAIKYGNLSSVLTFQKVGNIVKEDPLFYFGSRQDYKFSVVYGIGLWNWKLADYQMNQNNNSFNELVRKTIQYLILKENTSRLRINLPAISNSDDELIINAMFYNESYEPITEPNIRFELKNLSGKTFDYQFLPMNEEYHLNVGRLTSGRYSWEATTTYNGQTFTKNGSFATRDLKLEKQETKANHQLLRQIADNNQGEMEMLENYQSIIDKVLQRDDLIPVAYEASSYKKLIDYLTLLIIIITLFSTEWAIRKYLGGY